jgi:hypothetical protein
MRPLRVVVRRAFGEHVGAENPVTTCDLHVFVFEAAESVSSQRLDCCCGAWGSGACGRVLMQRALGTVGVVVLDVLVQHRSEVAGSGEQEMVEAYPAQGADEAFRDRVRAGCPDWGADGPDVGTGKDRVEGRVNVLSRSRINNRNRSARSSRSMNRLRACWLTRPRWDER